MSKKKCVLMSSTTTFGINWFTLMENRIFFLVLNDDDDKIEKENFTVNWIMCVCVFVYAQSA